MAEASEYADIQFSKMFIAKVKELPIIWDSRTRASAGIKTINLVWKKIGLELKMPINKLRAMWSSFRRHYSDILIIKAMERSNKYPEWELFHDLSFIYEETVQSIKHQLGGLTPPLFVRQEPLTSPCPCCLAGANKFEDIQILISEPRTITDFPGTETNCFETMSVDEKQDGAVFENYSSDATQSIPSTLDSTSLEQNQPTFESSSCQSPEPSKKPTIPNMSSPRKIINCIKKHPVLYTKDYRGPVRSVKGAWKMVSQEIGIPTITIQSRWQLYKNRYLEEVLKQRDTRGPFISTWGNFEEMEFMRETDYMKRSIKDIDRIRVDIHARATQQKSLQSIDLCAESDDDDDKNTDQQSQIHQRTKPTEIPLVDITRDDLIVEFTSSDMIPTDLPSELAIEPSDPTVAFVQIDPLANELKRSKNVDGAIPVVEIDLTTGEEDECEMEDHDGISSETKLETYEEISSLRLKYSPVNFAEPLNSSE